MGTASPDLSALAQPGAPAQGAAPAAPTPSAPPAVDPNQPHAKLIHMIQGLAEGVGAFATSAATGGRQGGVQEVAQFRAQQQQQRIQQQEADQQAKETGLRMQAMNASMQIQQAQFEHNKQMWPIEQKTAQITASDAASKALQDDLQTASGFGLDITDPAQKARYEQMKNEYSPAQQSAAAQAVQGSIKIPFTSGQNQDAVMQGVQAAIPNGKHLVDYQVIVEGGHGKDGQVTLIPNDALKQLQATPRQVNATTAEVNNALDAAKASGLQDDPQIKALQAQWQNVQNEIQKGGKLSVSDLNSLKFSVLGPVSSRIAGAATASKIAQQKSEASSAAVTAQNAPEKAALDISSKKLENTGKELTNTKTGLEVQKTQQEIDMNKQLLGSVDDFGNKVGLPGDLPKDVKQKQTKFAKDYIAPLNKLNKTAMEFQRINSNPNQTGAEKVTALLNAVGISGDPLKGSGFRISNDIINEHAAARNIWESALQKANTIFGSGGPITSKQISDYTAVAQGVIHDAYVTAAQEAQRQGLPVDFLPRPTSKGGVVDPLIAKIYLDAAGGDLDAAHNALLKAGYK